MAFTVAEINEDVRFYLGNLPISTISNDDMNKIIQMQVDKYSLEDSDRCSVYYYSTVETLRWLIRQQAQGSAGVGGSGEVKKRTEEINNRKISVEFDVGTSSGTSSGWDAILEDLVANPSLIGCTLPPTPIDTSIGSAIVHAPENAYEASFTSRNKFGKAIKKNRTSGRRLLF